MSVTDVEAKADKNGAAKTPLAAGADVSKQPSMPSA